MNSRISQRSSSIISVLSLAIAVTFALALSIPSIEHWATVALVTSKYEHLRPMYVVGGMRLVIAAATPFFLLTLYRWLANEKHPAKHALLIASCLSVVFLAYPFSHAIGITMLRFHWVSHDIGVTKSLLASLFVLGLVATASWAYAREHGTFLPTPSPGRRATHWRVWEGSVLLLILLLSLALRATLFAEAIPQDVLAYVTVADKWLSGAPLYQGAWDHKPPLGLSLVALFVWLFGPNPAAVFALEVTAFAVALLTIYLAARRSGGPTAAVAAAILWFAIGNDPLLEGNRFNMESLIVPCLAWSLYLLLPPWVPGREQSDPVSPRSEIGAGRAYVVGFAFFLCTAFKQSMIFLPAFVVVALLLSAKREGSALTVRGIRGVIFDSLRFLLVGLVGWGLTLLYFWLAGTFDAFYYAVFTYNSDYVASLFTNLYELIDVLTGSMFSYVYIVSAYGLAFIAVRHFPDRRHLLFVTYIAALLIVVVATGQGYGYYAIILTPLLSIAGGAWCARLFADWRAPVLAVFVGLFAFAAFSYYDTAQHNRLVHPWTPVRHQEAQRVGLLLKETLPEDAVMLHWGGHPGIYFWSERQSPTRYVYNFPLTVGSRREILQKELLEELAALKPDLIVTRQNKWSPPDHSVLLWIQENYELTDAYGPSTVYEFMVPKTPATD